MTKGASDTAVALEQVAGRSPADWPSADVAMAGRIRAFPWSTTSLGAVDDWPLSLRGAVDLILRSPLPMAVYWGVDGVMIFNDAYSEFAEARRPNLLGSEVLVAWPAMVELHRQALLAGLAGEALSVRRRYFLLHRRHQTEEACLDLDFIPILDDVGQSRGVLAIIVDQTQRVHDQAALKHLNDTLEARVTERTEALLSALDSLSGEIVERQAAESALRQSHKMEAVGQLTGGIAHDFNNLLTGVIGSLDLMQRRIESGRLDDVRRFAATAMSSANRAAALAHRLLAFSRRQPLVRELVDIDRLVTSIEDLLRRTMSEKIELNLAITAGGWRCECDPNQFESAVLNLAINARDAMPDGGRLTIRTGHVTVGVDQARGLDVGSGQYVFVAVQDTGEGMAPEVIDHVFEPFFTTKPLGVGTGLGLPMIYSFARQSGGAVKIESETCRGTTITIFLPRSQARPAADGEKPLAGSPHPASGGRVVLVVEDEQAVRGLVMEVLQDQGYRGLSATDGVAALEILHSEAHIDLLISDIGLPGLDGLQLVEAAIAKRPGLKVLLMTGHAPESVLGVSLKARGVRLMLKPFTVDVLLDHVRDSFETIIVPA